MGSTSSGMYNFVVAEGFQCLLGSLCDLNIILACCNLKLVVTFLEKMNKWLGLKICIEKLNLRFIDFVSQSKEPFKRFNALLSLSQSCPANRLTCFQMSW